MSGTPTPGFRGGRNPDFASPNAGEAANASFSLSPGDVLSRTFTVWFANLTSFTLLAGIVMMPGLLLMSVGTALGITKGVGVLLLLIGVLLQTVLRQVLTGAVTYGVFEDLRGQKTSLGEIMSAGFASIGNVLVVGIVSGVIIMLGLLAFCVPGFILITMYWLAIPVAVVESPGVTESLSRSADLTSGNRWQVFGTTLVMVLVQWAVAFGIGMVIGVVGIVASRGNPGHASGLTQLLQGVLMLPFDSLMAIAPVVAYHDLRINKEGADIEDLVKVFD
jgi:hypothetical protein